MKVLHYVSIMNRAGQETFIMNMYRNINRDKLQFGFLCTNDAKGDYDDEILELGGKIHYIKLSSEPSKFKFLNNFIIQKNSFKQYSREYQVFHIHTYHAFDALFSVMAAKLAGFKTVIVHSHNTSAAEHITAHKLCRNFLNILPIKKLACANAAGKWMYNNGKFTVINNAIDTNKFLFNQKLRDDYRKKLEIEDKYVIGHVGRFEEQKNHMYLIKIFAEYVRVNKDAVLLLIGKGSLEDKARKLVEELNIVNNVRFLGSRDDVDSLYQAIDLFLLPSKYEGLPVVLVEAQMASLPCVITDNITKEIDVTNKVYRCSVTEEPAKWAEVIERARVEASGRCDETESLKKNSFEVKGEAEKLMEFYFSN